MGSDFSLQYKLIYHVNWRAWIIYTHCSSGETYKTWKPWKTNTLKWNVPFLSATATLLATYIQLAFYRTLIIFSVSLSSWFSTHTVSMCFVLLSKSSQLFAHRLIKPAFSNSLARKVRETHVAESEKYMLQRNIEIHIYWKSLLVSGSSSRPLIQHIEYL